MASVEKQVQQFIAKYAPEVARNATQVRAKLRKRMVGTQELVYDNYNALAIAYSPTGKVGDVICSIALYPRWVSLFFMQGAKLSDPRKLLRGSGKTIRHIVLEDGVKTFDSLGVRELVKRACDAATVVPTGKKPPVTVIKSVSAKQRPRRAKPTRKA